jgi:hypothetical protein
MKNNFLKFLFVSSLLIASCKKEDTYDIIPGETTTSGLQFSTPQGQEGAVIGAYNNAQGAEFLSGRALVYVDLMGDDVFDRQGFFGDVPRFNALSNNGLASGFWATGYLTIGGANRAIKGITENPGVVTATKANQLIGEAKFLRAVSHFYLVNMFAQTYTFTSDASHIGVPVITTSFGSATGANTPRNTVKQVYDQILLDLNDALANLPNSYTGVYQTRTRATKAAAAAMLARVYLYMGDWARANTNASAVIAGTYGAYALRPTPNGAFGSATNNQTNESIWSIPNSTQDNPNTNNALPQHYFPNGRADLPLSSNFLDIATNPFFAMDDLRRTNMIVPGVAATNTTAFRFTNKYPQTTTRADWSPILRYAEVLLTSAEAKARLATGVDASAITHLNLVRDRARVSASQYSVTSFATKQDLINAVLGERRIELVAEGHRFWDLMRNKLPLVGKKDNDGIAVIPTLPANAPRAIWPIPQREIDASAGALVQNPTY